ncbi:hypothetical protein BRC83_08655 [Halobacteriales archaeon QS_1_68_17]|nr:MAG: hypothetical protein BRC83_08655 [Halobacteriales archaeon QS_1_68_17]
MAEDSETTWTTLYESENREKPLMPTEPLPFVADVIEYLRDRGCEAVLEAACGEGRNTRRFASSLPAVCGCDVSQEALDTCARRCEGAVDLRTADVRALPYPDGRFDATVMLDALTHLRDVELVLRELARVTATGGEVVFNLPLAGDDVTERGSLRHRYASLEEYRYDLDGPEVVYMVLRDPDRFERTLSALGLAVTDRDRYRWEDPPHPEYRRRRHGHENVLIYARKTGPGSRSGG